MHVGSGFPRLHPLHYSLQQLRILESTKSSFCGTSASHGLFMVDNCSFKTTIGHDTNIEN